MGTSINRYTNLTDIYKIGRSYYIPSAPVNGMSPWKIAEVADEALYRARHGKGPTFLELKTYRFRGHSMSDAEPYRNKEEIEKYKKIDPILLVKKHLFFNKWANEEIFKIIEEEIKKSIEECVEFAGNSYLPTIKNMDNIVYDTCIYKD
jgi:pyruvate dehydrogenase E1 component alpha subunit